MTTESDQETLDRRQVLKRIAVLVGGSISLPVLSGGLASCGRTPAVVWHPETFTAEQDQLVTTIAELIIPATDTPGAETARVNEFIDLMLTHWFEAEEKDRFLAGLADIEALAMVETGRPFLQLTAEEQTALLEPLDTEAALLRLTALQERSEVEEMPFFGTMKELTLVGYYTSEIGLRQELHFVDVPTRFEGCVPVDDINQTST